MTLLEDYSREAVAEVLAIFRETHRRMGEFQVTKKVVVKIIKERFGLPFRGHGEGRRLTKHVIDTLLKRGILELWDTIVRKQSTLLVYQVNTTLLHND